MLQIFNSGTSYSDIVKLLKLRLSQTPPMSVGEWHSQRVSHPLQRFHELYNVILDLPVPENIEDMQRVYEPNLPWAEDHFQERISGVPLNPPPSAQWWPFAQNNHTQHVDYHSQFSHSYPERLYPKQANAGGKTPEGRQVWVPHVGIRYMFGDLDDVIALLAKKPFTRQAYVPIFFPEDTGNVSNVRIPCTIGYHFQIRQDAEIAYRRKDEYRLNCTYTIRSCDLYRHMNDDIYMSARLMLHVLRRVSELGDLNITMGNLVVHIMNLHVLAGDFPKMYQDLRKANQP